MARIRPQKRWLLALSWGVCWACGNSKIDGRPHHVDPGSGRAKSVHLALGIPTDRDSSDDLLLVKTQYALSYNPRRGGPNWVSWNLNASHFGPVKRYRGKFLPDESLPAGVYRVRHEDYLGSGYDRGHMVQSEERTATPEDNIATFLLTNILPQTHELNAGPWLALEEECNSLARSQGKELFVIAGGIYSEAPAVIGQGVAVPDAYFKVAVVLERGQGPADVTTSTRVLAAQFPNVHQEVAKSWVAYRVSVDAIEQAIGYDLLSDIDSAVQQSIEATVERGR